MPKIIEHEQIDDYFEVEVADAKAIAFVKSYMIEVEKVPVPTEEFFGQTIWDYEILDTEYNPAPQLEEKLNDVHIKQETETQIQMEVEDYLKNGHRMCA